MLNKGRLNGIPVSVNVDSEAYHVFMSLDTARQCGLNLEEDRSEVELGDSSKTTVHGTVTATLQVSGASSTERIYVLQGPDKNTARTVIVGRKWLRQHEPQINWRTRELKLKREDGKTYIVRPKLYRNTREKIQISHISLKRMKKMVRKGDCELFTVRLNPQDGGMKIREDFTDITEEFNEIFVDELPSQLTPKRDVDFEIKLKSDEPPPVRPVIRLSVDELKELKRQLQKLLEKGLIRSSASPYGEPVFFVKKKSGELRMVCDYRALNKITIADSNPLSLIGEAIDQVKGATVFSQLDLIGAYHQMRIREEDCEKTAIRTRFGSFEWRVLCFGLTNAPAAFTRLLSTLLRDLNGDCLVLFLDDVLLYSKSIQEHRRKLRILLKILRDNNLYVKRSKCAIGAEEVDLLGYRTSREGVHTQRKIINAITEWPEPSNIKEVQSFLALTNFYGRFVKGYADISRPISDLVRQKQFIWESGQLEAFQNLKKAMTTAPVLRHPTSKLRFQVYTDASKYAVGATLQQEGHPVAFISHRLSQAENNWNTGDQELLAFIVALREWDVYHRGRKFELHTDHEPIRYLQSKARLIGRQARWLDELQSYDYDVDHVPGKHNVVADALSRRSDHIQLKNIRIENGDLQRRIISEYAKNEWSQTIINSLNGSPSNGNSRATRQASNFSYDGVQLFWKGTEKKRAYIPDYGSLRKDITEYFHGQAHLGKDKVFNSVAMYKYWPRMYQSIEAYISTCHVCQRNKIPNRKQPGLLQPLIVPDKCWQHVTADFVTKSRKSRRGNDTVLVLLTDYQNAQYSSPLMKPLRPLQCTSYFRIIFSLSMEFQYVSFQIEILSLILDIGSLWRNSQT